MAETPEVDEIEAEAEPEPEPESNVVDDVPAPEAEGAWSSAPAAAREPEAVLPEPVEEAAYEPASAVAMPAAASATFNGELSEEQLDRIARRVVEMLSDKVIRDIAWEVIPDAAQMIVKERIRELEAEA